MEKLKTLTINKKKYPYKCDLFVLEELQKEYKDIFEFERKLKGLIYKLDKNGNRIYNEDGSPAYDREHFDLHALNLIFPLMINEGLEIEGQSRNKEIEAVDPQELIRTCDIPLYELWTLIVQEYDRCMFGKK
jgi:hypothetical protein